MRLMIVAAMAALSVMGQDAKVAPAPEKTAAANPSERPLTEVEVLKLKLAMSQIENLNTKYKIEDYQKEVAPISAEQRAVAVAACKSVGVPEDKVEKECGLSFGKGPDGKDVSPRVWKIPPPAEKK